MTESDQNKDPGVTVGRVNDEFSTENATYAREVESLKSRAISLLKKAKELKEQRNRVIQLANTHADRAYGYMLLMGKNHEDIVKEIKSWQSTTESQ